MGRRRHSERDGAPEQFAGRGRHGQRALDPQPGGEREYGRHDHRHGHPATGESPRGEHACGQRALAAQPGGEREFGRHGRHGQWGGRGHHGRPEGERAFGGHRDTGGHRHHRPDHELSEAELAQRQLARQVRREVRRVLRQAEAAGLSPERAARVVRRETRRSFL